MAQTSKAIREAYNARTYRQFKLRVRKNTDLCEAIEASLATKNASLNYLVTKLLAEYYGVAMPEPHPDN